MAKGLGAFLLGALAVLALPPFSVPLVLPVIFGGLFKLTECTQPPQALGIGTLFGLGFFLFGLSWIAESFYVDADRFGWMALPAVTGLAAFLALFPAAAMALFARSQLTGLPGAFVFSVCWSGAEWVRGTVLTGFPWNLIGYAWADYAVPRQAAAWIGSYGLGLVTVLLATLPVIVLMSRGRRQRLIALGLFTVLMASLWIGGAVRLVLPQPPASGQTVRVVQGNIPQSRKWDPAFRDRNIARYLNLSSQPGSFDLLLWPESAFPGYLDEEPAVLERIAALLPQGANLLTGAQTREAAPAGAVYRNSILAIADTGTVTARYAKHHLVPFGEYLPLRGVLPIERLTVGLGDFTQGPGPGTFQLPDFPPVGLSICYEAIFPARLVDRANRPAWVFNATNDAWFGSSLGPWQHLASARMRAVEEGLPVVRAANTGISAVIDAAGGVTARLDLERTGILDAPLPPALPPTAFARFGQWPFALLLLIFAITAVLGRRTRHQEDRGCWRR